MARSKSHNQRKHARRRAFQRYGLELHQDAQAQIIRAIQGGEARFIERQSQRVSIFEVDHDGQRLPVVYDRKRKTIITVLPQEVLAERSNHERDQ